MAAWNDHMHCRLCAPDLSPIIFESQFWQLVLNRNQNLLGKCFLVVRRHIEAVPALKPEEWQDLFTQLSCTTNILLSIFRPDHFNYAFLQNQDRHVHLHVIPRYSSPGTFGSLLFADSDYPGHYSVPSPARILSNDVFQELADTFRQPINSQPGS